MSPTSMGQTVPSSLGCGCCPMNMFVTLVHVRHKMIYLHVMCWLLYICLVQTFLSRISEYECGAVTCSQCHKFCLITITTCKASLYRAFNGVLHVHSSYDAVCTPTCSCSVNALDRRMNVPCVSCMVAQLLLSNACVTSRYAYCMFQREYCCSK